MPFAQKRVVLRAARQRKFQTSEGTVCWTRVHRSLHRRKQINSSRTAGHVKSVSVCCAVLMTVHMHAACGRGGRFFFVGGWFRFGLGFGFVCVCSHCGEGVFLFA